jgi:hypothetical protein
MTDASNRLETAGLITATLLAAAFVASFVFGVVRRPTVREPAPSAREQLPVVPATLRGRLEVLNATGRSGLARAATGQLREAGFDVVFFGNARERRDSSVVLDRIGRRDIADAAAAALSIHSVRTAKDSTLLLDATIVIGADWQREH